MKYLMEYVKVAWNIQNYTHEHDYFKQALNFLVIATIWWCGIENFYVTFHLYYKNFESNNGFINKVLIHSFFEKTLTYDCVAWSVFYGAFHMYITTLNQTTGSLMNYGLHGHWKIAYLFSYNVLGLSVLTHGSKVLFI